MRPTILIPFAAILSILIQSSTHAQDTRLQVDRFWSPYQYAASLGAFQTSAFRTRHLFWKAPDELWVLGSFSRDEETKGPSDAIFRVKLPGFETEALWIPDVGGYYDAAVRNDKNRLAVSDEYVCVTGNKRPLLKYNRRTGGWKVFGDVTHAQDGIIFGDSLYVSAVGEIRRINLKSDAVRSIADIRRDPKEAPLDNAAFSSLTISGTVADKILFAGAGKDRNVEKYLFDPGASTWSPYTGAGQVDKSMISYTQDQRIWGKCRFELGEREKTVLDKLPWFNLQRMLAGDPVNYGYRGTPQGVLILGVNQSWPGFWFVSEEKVQQFLSGRR